MYQFFIENENVSDGFVTIEGSDVNHMKNVLRMKPGERIRVSTRDGRAYFCEVAELTDLFVLADILEQDEEGTELPCKIYLFQGLPKSDKMELIIQKAVELGVYEVIPVAMKNCVMKLDEKKAKSKITRWQAIAESAAKQSGRSICPEVALPLSFAEAIQESGSADRILVPYENARGMAATKEQVEAVRPGMDIAVFIGPEGGFEETEVEEAKAAGFYPVSLGKRILRTETAGLTMLSILMYQMETAK